MKVIHKGISLPDGSCLVPYSYTWLSGVENLHEVFGISPDALGGFTHAKHRSRAGAQCDAYQQGNENESVWNCRQNFGQRCFGFYLTNFRNNLRMCIYLPIKGLYVHCKTFEFTYLRSGSSECSNIQDGPLLYDSVPKSLQMLEKASKFMKELAILNSIRIKRINEWSKILLRAFLVKSPYEWHWKSKKIAIWIW